MPQDRMANYIETQNIAYYKGQLETETHLDKRKMLVRLLAEEEAKHAARIALVKKACLAQSAALGKPTVLRQDLDRHRGSIASLLGATIAATGKGWQKLSASWQTAARP